MDGVKLEAKLGICTRLPTRPTFASVRFDTRAVVGRPPDQRCFDLQDKLHSDLFVFTVISHKLDEPIDPLILDHWIFFVLPTAILARRHDTNTITVSSISGLGAIPLNFRTLKEVIIDSALAADFTRLDSDSGKFRMQVALATATGVDGSKNLQWIQFQEWSASPQPRSHRFRKIKNSLGSEIFRNLFLLWPADKSRTTTHIQCAQRAFGTGTIPELRQKTRSGFCLSGL